MDVSLKGLQASSAAYQYMGSLHGWIQDVPERVVQGWLQAQGQTAAGPGSCSGRPYWGGRAHHCLAPASATGLKFVPNVCAAISVNKIIHVGSSTHIHQQTDRIVKLWHVDILNSVKESSTPVCYSVSECKVSMCGRVYASTFDFPNNAWHMQAQSFCYLWTVHYRNMNIYKRKSSPVSVFLEGVNCTYSSKENSFIISALLTQPPLWNKTSDWFVR